MGDQNNDRSFVLIQAFSLAATNYLANGATGSKPYEIITMVGCNHLSFTAQITGSTPAGTLLFEGTDFGYATEVYQQNIWAPLNQPGTTTQYQIAVAAAANYNIQIPNLGVKFIRVKWNYTSGSGNLNAAVTCRANSR
jgi:hypothetical protein